jgi:hypothetical protein
MSEAELTCWRCGVEPVDTAEIHSGSGLVRTLPAEWPPGDHAHAVSPPTPDQLANEGRRILDRITQEWTRD